MSEFVGATVQRAMPAQAKGEDMGAKQTCITFAKSGICCFGDNCRYEHATKKKNRGRNARDDSGDGNHKKEESKPTASGSNDDCILFARNGSCPYEVRCKFRHPPIVRQSGMLSIVAIAKGPEGRGVEVDP